MKKYFAIEGTGDPAALAALGMFLHADAHKRSWICQERAEALVELLEGDEAPVDFLRRAGPSSLFLPEATVHVIPADNTALFLSALDSAGPPPRAVRQTPAERDRFVSEKPYDCRVNDAYSGRVLLVERLYERQTTIWYGTLDVACNSDEFMELGYPMDLQIELEDGRIGPARAVWGKANEVTDDGVERGLELGDSCLCHIVGVGPLAKPLQLPSVPNN